MKVNSSIFRLYDIRGIAGEKFENKAIAEYERWYGKFPGITITPEVANALGKAYGTRIRKRGGREIIIGHEIRPYGEELKMQFITGVLSTGCNVYDAGVSLTPIIYFSTAFYKLDGGVNVTGSHNVYFFNGFKTMARDVYPIFGEEIQEMRQSIEDESFVQDNKGSYTKKDVVPDYKKYLIAHCPVKRKLKIVLDCGNGSAGEFAPTILRELGCEVTDLYNDPNPSFPNHVPDPEDPFVMTDLQKKVIEVGADLGIGLDADGDRCGLVDEKGEFIYADRTLLVFAKDILSRNHGKKILFDVKCSRLLSDLVPKFGGEPLMHVTGHAPIKQTMREDTEIIFAGEVSGHFYFAEDYFRIDDGLYSAAKFLALVSQTDKPVSSLFTDIPDTVMTPELKLPCSDEKKKEIVQNIVEEFQKKYQVITLDGARVVFSKTSWGLCRASNTSPYLTIRVEADTKAEVLKIKNIFQDIFDKYPDIGDKLNRKAVSTHTGKLGWV